MDDLIKVNEEVFYSRASIQAMGPEAVDFIKKQAAENPRRRCRICLHPHPDHPFHDMLIVHAGNTYVRPHLHNQKVESTHVVEGKAIVVIFDGKGLPQNAFAVGGADTGFPFLFRIEPGTVHMLLIQSEWLVFHESTTGPFDPAMTRFPNWAPDESNPSAVRIFMARIEGLAGAYLAPRKK